MTPYDPCERCGATTEHSEFTEECMCQRCGQQFIDDCVAENEAPSPDRIAAPVLQHAIDHVLRTSYTTDRRFVDDASQDAYYMLAKAAK